MTPADKPTASHLTPEELAALREMQAQLMGIEQSPWQPACVAKMFSSSLAENPFVFTMATWIDLDSVRSPFLQGALPEAESAEEDFKKAFAAFGYANTTPENCNADELLLLGRKVIKSINDGFGMGIRMAPPKELKKTENNAGFGDWLSVMACLITQLHLSIGDAYAVPVGRAFGLIAAHRGNEGWNPTDTSYARRELSKTHG